MYYVVLQKAIKPGLVAKKVSVRGKLKTYQAVRWVRPGVAVAHGTDFESAMKILYEGLFPQKFHNFGNSLYREDRANKVFVTRSRDIATYFARWRQKKTGKSGVVLEIEIPTNWFYSHAKEDLEMWGNLLNEKSYELPFVKPEWIKNITDTEGQKATETISSLTGKKFNKAMEVDMKKVKKEKTIKLYVPVSLGVLKKILKEKRK